MTMVLTVPGATPEEIAKGLQAAQAVLDAAKVSDVLGARAQFTLEGWDVAGGLKDDDDKPGAAVFDAADALARAREAAIDACCEGWAERPVEWSLDVLLGPPELCGPPASGAPPGG